MTAFTEPDRMTLEFCLSQKEIINSNMTFKHFMQKAVMVDNLRSKSAETGASRHPQSELVYKYLEDLDTERKNAANGSTTRFPSGSGYLPAARNFPPK